VLNGPATASVLQMTPANTPGQTILFGGSEFTVLLTFQLPALPLAMTMPNSGSAIQLLSVYGPNFNLNLYATTNGGSSNSGNVSASFSYSSMVNSILTQIQMPTPPMVSMPMLYGGWVSAALSVSSTGVVSFSARDIFTATNVTTGAP